MPMNPFSLVALLKTVAGLFSSLLSFLRDEKIRRDERKKLKLEAKVEAQDEIIRAGHARRNANHSAEFVSNDPANRNKN